MPFFAVSVTFSSIPFGLTSEFLSFVCNHLLHFLIVAYKTPCPIALFPRFSEFFTFFWRRVEPSGYGTAATESQGRPLAVRFLRAQHFADVQCTPLRVCCCCFPRRGRCPHRPAPLLIIILKQSRVSAALSRMWLGFYLRLFFTMNTATAATPTRLTTIMPIHRPMLALSPVLGADQGLVL